ncbi:MAG: WxL domain-containing protein [Lactobacillus sp.]|nr:WxL domain-containing protein [Lactobacillus sp.]
MKMNKLFSSVAASAMVLTALAPAAVANAATGHPITNGSLGSGQKDTLAVVANDSLNGTDGSATANSRAQVDVIDGVLVLNAVPNFGFEASTPDQTAAMRKLTKNDTFSGDGNNDGRISISDSRHSSGTIPDGLGYKLSAQLGNFDGPTAAAPGWVLQLGSVANSNTGSNAQPSLIANLSTMNASLAAGAPTSTPVLVAPANKSWGNAEFTFGPSNASLKVPAVAAGSYVSQIDWTLSADPA